MIYFISIFISVFIYFLVFNTPFFIINYIFGCSQMNPYYLNYYIYKNNYKYSKTFKINHFYYDGRLTSMVIKKKKIKLNNLKKIDDVGCKIYNKHNILSNLLNIPKNNTTFSSLNYNVAHLLKYISLIQKKKLRVCVIVSKRNQNEYSKGNLIKFAFFNVNMYMDNVTIMKIFKYSVENSKKCSKKFINIYDIIKFLNCDIIINSWKELSQIETNNGLLLNRFESKILSEFELLNHLLDEKKGKIIFFDKYNNDWIINKIENINIINSKFFF